MKYIYVGRLPASICAEVSMLLARESLNQAAEGNLDEAKDLIQDAKGLLKEVKMTELEEEMEREEI